MKKLVMVIVMVLMMASTAYGGVREMETENSWVFVTSDQMNAIIRAKDRPDDRLVVSFERNGNGKIAGVTWEKDVYDGIWLVGEERINFDEGWITREFIEYPYHMFYNKDR